MAIQGILVDIFINGIKNTSVARHLIRKNPKTLEEAVALAKEEQLVQRAFKLQGTGRGSGVDFNSVDTRVIEPMEVDDVHKPQDNTTNKRLDQLEQSLLILSEVVKMQGINKKQREPPVITPIENLNRTPETLPTRTPDRTPDRIPDRTPVRTPRRTNRDGRPICYQCNQPGHIRRDCPRTTVYARDTRRGNSWNNSRAFNRDPPLN